VLNSSRFRDAPKAYVPARTHAQAALYTRKVWAVVVERISGQESRDRDPSPVLTNEISLTPDHYCPGKWNQQTPQLW